MVEQVERVVVFSDVDLEVVAVSFVQYCDRGAVGPFAPEECDLRCSAVSGDEFFGCVVVGEAGDHGLAFLWLIVLSVLRSPMQALGQGMAKECKGNRTNRFRRGEERHGVAMSVERRRRFRFGPASPALS